MQWIECNLTLFFLFSRLFNKSSEWWWHFSLVCCNPNGRKTIWRKWKTTALHTIALKHALWMFVVYAPVAHNRSMICLFDCVFFFFVFSSVQFLARKKLCFHLLSHNMKSLCTLFLCCNFSSVFSILNWSSARSIYTSLTCLIWIIVSQWLGISIGLGNKSMAIWSHTQQTAHN